MAKLPVQKLKASKKPIPVKIVHDTPSPNKYAEEDKKWRAEDALRDIERAETHKRDKALMKEVETLAKAKIDSLKKIC